MTSVPLTKEQRQELWIQANRCIITGFDLARELERSHDLADQQLEAARFAIDTLPVDVMLAAGPPFNVKFTPAAFDLIVKAHRVLMGVKR